MVKGFVKTLEAGIAIALILVSMIFLFNEQTKTEAQLSDTAYSCLLYSDYNGSLRDYASRNMESELVSNLRSCLPPLLNYTARICTTSYCSSSDLPENKTIFLSSYMLAGENSFEPKLINLWVWSE